MIPKKLDQVRLLTIFKHVNNVFFNCTVSLKIA